MVDFMYYGEVNVSQDQLPAILKIAEMLKIKGLADMPSVASTVAQGIDKDSRRSASPMSPAARRKRLRKSSTGSGSGSTGKLKKKKKKTLRVKFWFKCLFFLEQTSEELVSEGVLGHSPSVKIGHVEDGQRTSSRQSLRNSHQDPSTDSEPKEGSQDSGAEDYKRQSSNESRQISYENRQISTESRQGSFEIRQSSHESKQSSFDSRQISHESRQGSHEGRQQTPQPSLDGRQASHESRLSQESSVESVTTDLEPGGTLSPSPGQTKVGTKRGRLLMRQQRIKKENDVHMSPDSDPGSPSFTATSLLSVPPVKIERQRSEPAASTQTHSPPPQSSNLLTVPQPSFPVVRQHSFPSQSPLNFPPGTVFTVQRQLSQPLTSAKSVQMAEESSRSGSPSVAAEMVPIVRVIPDATETKTNSFPYRQRSEESKRQQSAEIAETCRSVHCPVLRSGPALGCNYCWNTIDAHGRILRRKTKYHCPECQTNLCIVPCFQEYHQRQVEVSNKPEGQPSASWNPEFVIMSNFWIYQRNEKSEFIFLSPRL